MRQAVKHFNRLALFGAVLMLGACATSSGPAADGPRVAEQPASQKTVANDAQQRAKVHTELGALYLQDGRLPVAMEEARIAIESDSSYAPAYSLLGLVHMYLDERNPAEDAFRRALRIAPNDPEINNNFGWFLCQTKRENESLGYFRLAYRNSLYLTPTKPYTNAGICMMQVKDYKAAEDYLFNALRYDQNNSLADYWLGELYLRTDRLQEARARLLDLTKRIEPTVELLWLGVRIERKAGDREAEMRYVTQLRRRFPNSTEYQKYMQGQFE